MGFILEKGSWLLQLRKQPYTDNIFKKYARITFFMEFKFSKIADIQPETLK